MVFSSVPVYLDPSNWPQQPNHQQGGAGENLDQFPPLMPPPPPVGGGSGTASIRPNSMAERARLAKLPQPDVALKCPRCESSNTKFCYYNNYSLTQPRHFCKTCRRYWTRGGALRNVPVGGGCRRNKRSKGSKSKSEVTSENQSSNSTTSTSAISSFNSCSTNDMINHLPIPSQVSFFPPLHNLTGISNANMGLNFNGIQKRDGGIETEYEVANTSGAMGAGPLNLSARFADQWRLQQQVQQFPFLAGLEQSSAGVYPFESTGSIDQPLMEGGSSIKLEDNQQGSNLPRNFLSNIPGAGNDQYWSGNVWTDLSGSTSSASHLI